MTTNKNVEWVGHPGAWVLYVGAVLLTWLVCGSLGFPTLLLSRTSQLSVCTAGHAAYGFQPCISPKS